MFRTKVEGIVNFFENGHVKIKFTTRQKKEIQKCLVFPCNYFYTKIQIETIELIYV